MRLASFSVCTPYRANTTPRLRWVCDLSFPRVRYGGGTTRRISTKHAKGERGTAPLLLSQIPSDACACEQGRDLKQIKRCCNESSPRCGNQQRLSHCLSPFRLRLLSSASDSPRGDDRIWFGSRSCPALS